jgi:hypothetical protein
MKHIKITHDGPANATVTLDDQDITEDLITLDIQLRPRQTPTVTLHLRGLDETDLTKANASVPKRTRQILEALGWTPPKDGR